MKAKIKVVYDIVKVLAIKRNKVDYHKKMGKNQTFFKYSFKNLFWYSVCFIPFCCCYCCCFLNFCRCSIICNPCFGNNSVWKKNINLTRWISIHSVSTAKTSGVCQWILIYVIHLIPKWRPINYSFVCMLISFWCLVSM